MQISRSFINILSGDLSAARKFYTEFLQLELRFDSDWFINLGVPGNEALELGIIKVEQEIVPPQHQQTPAGAILTLVVEDVAEVEARARAMNVTIVEGVRNLFYGQRRLLVADPDGFLIDLSSECEPDAQWVKKVKQHEGGWYYETSD